MEYIVDTIKDDDYTISAINKGIICKVYNYYSDNPYVSIIGKNSLSDLKKLICKIEGQQKDINYFGGYLSEMNSNGNA